MVVLIDNFDSFTYNILDYLQQCGLEVQLYRNNEINLQELEALQPGGIVLSPGPGRPSDHPLLAEVIGCFSGKVPLLGICLGHQAIGEYYGARLAKAPVPVHGKVSELTHQGHTMYRGIPEKFMITRYHSLLLEDLEKTELVSTATTKEGLNMSLTHRLLPIWGIQYHPEAVLTEYGLQLLNNWASNIT